MYICVCMYTNKYIYRWLYIVNDVFLKQYTHTYIYICTCSVAKLYLTPCHHMNGNAPGSSVHEIFQVRVLECVAIPFTRDTYVCVCVYIYIYILLCIGIKIFILQMAFYR